MENQVNDQTGNLIEEFPDEFQCCVCLDLFYKPVVLACGHIACFWCVFKAMDYWKESHCPVCRNPYNHFPNICWLLNFVLIKLYPSAYKRRETQITEEERKSENFSPQFENYSSQSQSQSQSCLTSSMEEGEPSSIKDSSVAIFADKDSTNIPTNSSCKAIGNVGPQENCMLKNKPVLGPCEQVHITDLLCGLCKQLLYRPLVLNCGHVYCEACISNPSSKICKCEVCQCVNPNGFPKVCLVLEHFLEEQFSKEYAARRLAVLDQTGSQSGTPLLCSTQAQENGDERPLSPITEYSSWWRRQGPKVHAGVGCDHCGMSPIIGKRYNCKDCLEKLGFDLCEGCYDNNRSSNLPGRFNQQHKPEHKFEIVDPISASLDDDEHSSEMDGYDYPEDSDDDFPLPGSSDGNEQMDSESEPPIAPNDDIESYEEISPDLAQYYEAEIARLRQEALEAEIRHRQELDEVRAEVAQRRRQFIDMMRRAGFNIPDESPPSSP